MYVYVIGSGHWNGPLHLKLLRSLFGRVTPRFGDRQTGWGLRLCLRTV